ncbi:SCAN domain-containing protein 3-like [Palaemon carinicauda]|uniref:SCAN domain-containing protein 3-like n=1 Tax=Palaemon carinicauda TaxID=392227 RepID=UPI0035B5C606
MSAKKRKYIEDYIRFRFVSLQKELVLGKDSANKLSQISLSNDTVKKRIEELSQDIKHQTLNQENQLSWESLVGVCTDGAPAMRGLRFRFVTKVKENNPSVMSTHCILHREALASRTLPAKMMDVLNVAIKVINFIKAGALNSRLFKLLCKDMESEHEALLFHMNQGNAASFRNLDSALADSNLDSELKQQIITHLSDLKAEFIRYFQDIDDKHEAWKFIRNPFHCEVANVACEVQEEFLELKFNSTAKEDFKDMDLETF